MTLDEWLHEQAALVRRAEPDIGPTAIARTLLERHEGDFFPSVITAKMVDSFLHRILQHHTPREWSVATDEPADEGDATTDDVAEAPAPVPPPPPSEPKLLVWALLKAGQEAGAGWLAGSNAAVAKALTTERSDVRDALLRGACPELVTDVVACQVGPLDVGTTRVVVDGTVLEVVGPFLVIGSCPACNVVVNDASGSVSRVHCVAIMTPRAVVVLDNWSLYGTELKDGPGSFRGSRRPLFENRSSSPVLVLAGEVEVKIL